VGTAFPLVSTATALIIIIK